jgi:hypothetical protein
MGERTRSEQSSPQQDYSTTSWPGFAESVQLVQPCSAISCRRISFSLISQLAE